MSLVVTIDGVPVTHDFSPSGLNITHRADGEAAAGGIPLEDPDGTLTIVGHRPVTVEEDACAQPRLFTGWITQRDIGRAYDEALIVDEARIVDTTLVDLNSCLAWRQITGADGNRPAETWAARLTWILGSDYLSEWISADETWIVTNTVAIEPADYRGSYPTSVLDDLVDRSGGAYTYYCFWDAVASEARLFFDNDVEVISSCSLSISNVIADVDYADVFPPDDVARLAREPDQTYSDVTITYDRGAQKLHRYRPSTATTYVRRGTEIARPYTRGLATATAQAEKWLDKHAVETDRITCTIRVPAASVGLVQAGQSIQARFSHLGAPYSAAGGATMRIVSCSPKPTDDTGYWYDVALELVAKPAAVPIVCSMSLAGIEHTSVMAEPLPAGTGLSQAISLAITPTADSMLLAIVAAIDGDVPSATDMTAITGYTTLTTDPHNDKTTYTTGYKVGAAGVLATAAASYTQGYGILGSPQDPYGAIHVAIPTDATSPVQMTEHVVDQAFAMTSPPTPGNMLVALVWAGQPGADPEFSASAGWTEIAQTFMNIPSTGRALALGAFAHCVEVGESNSYIIDLLGSYSSGTVTMTEWAISGSGGAADTIIDLGPTPGATTEHTVDPTVDDDAAAGYTVGSRWLNTSTNHEFVLLDSTTGSAVWVSTTAVSVFSFSTSDGVTTVDPTTELTFVGGTLADLGGGVAELTFTGSNAVTNIDGGKEVVSTVAAAGATETLDLADGNVHDVTLDQDATLTFAGATAGVACSFTLLLRQDGTGGWTTTWPGSVVWAGGTAPTLDETASTVAVLTFFTLDGGTVWYGFPTGGGGVAGGTPALTFGTTNAQGSATTAVLTDATLAIFDATVPTTAASSDAAATGSAAFAARRDHRHGMPAFAGELLVADSPLPVPRGTFSTTAHQTVASTTTAYAVAFATDDLKIGLTHSTVTNNSRIYIDQAGTYSIIVSAIADDTAADKTHLALWLAVDGTNVANSNTVVEIATKETEVVVAVAFAYDFTAGQYFELMYRGDATTARFIQTAAGATPTRPASPAVIVAVNMEAPAAGLLTNGPTPLLDDAAADFLYADT